jgi:hypothetical protein
VRLSIIMFSLLLTASTVLAQTQQTQPQNWTPQAIQILGQSASSRTEFSFDHSMLVMAAKTDPEDEGLRRVIAGVDGISVHRFRFPGPGMYDPQLLDSARQEYQAAGWQHVTFAHGKDGGPAAKDIWFRFENNTIRNFALIFVNSDQINFITVSGSISPIDLLHLAGHFGIPKIQGGVVIQAPTGGQQLTPAQNGTY